MGKTSLRGLNATRSISYLRVFCRLGFSPGVGEGHGFETFVVGCVQTKSTDLDLVGCRAAPMGGVGVE
jgi:hypothetical protein